MQKVTYSLINWLSKLKAGIVYLACVATSDTYVTSASKFYAWQAKQCVHRRQQEARLVLQSANLASRPSVDQIARQKTIISRWPDLTPAVQAADILAVVSLAWPHPILLMHWWSLTELAKQWCSALGDQAHPHNVLHVHYFTKNKCYGINWGDPERAPH